MKRSWQGHRVILSLWPALFIILSVIALTAFGVSAGNTSSPQVPQPWFFTLQLPPNGTLIPLENAGTVGMASSIQYQAIGKFQEITINLTSLLNEDRGLLLTMHLPVIDPAAWYWHYGPNEKSRMDNVTTPTSAAWYPLTVLACANGGFSVAVPVTHPAVCRFYRVTNEVRLEFSLGTSPLTRPTPNTVTVKILVWNIDPSWGFRQALQDYYDCFPSFYKRRNTRTGLWSTATPERLKVTAPFLFHEHGNMWFSLVDSSARDLPSQIATDSQYAWVTFPYLHIGQMSRINLTELPATEEEVDAFLLTQPEVYQPQQLKQYTDMTLTNNDYKASLEASRVEYANRVPRARMRETLTQAIDPETGKIIKTWSTIGKQVSFVMNPHPAVIVNGIPGHGKRMMEWILQILEQNPHLGGIYVDSLIWANYANYRREHFPSTTLPLACDSEGKVYLPNAWGHYEFFQTLRGLLDAKGKFLMVNGAYARPEYFFLSSFADILGNEHSIDPGPFARYCLIVGGPKTKLRLAPYVGDYDQTKLRQYLNSSLALGILPSSWGSYFSLPEWVNSEESFATSYGGNPVYSRDADLWQQVFDLIEPLGGAGWKPVTRARSDAPGVVVERFEKGSSHVFTLYRAEDAAAQTVRLSIEKSLTGNSRPVAVLLPTNRRIPVTETQSSYDVSLPLPVGPNALAIVKVTHVPLPYILLLLD